MISTQEIMDLALELSGLQSVPADSAILTEGENIRSILFGIDAGAAELQIAKDRGYDAVISHHPSGGSAVVEFHRVFSRHVQQMTEAGVPDAVAEQAVRSKATSLEVEGHTRNYNHVADVARLMKIPYMNIHTPLDELGRRIMIDQINDECDEDSPVREVVSALERLPEFSSAATRIELRLGNPTNRAGNIVVSHGAGTNGGYEIAKTYFQHSVDTLVYIHVSPQDLEKLRADRKGNLIVTGHVASDSVGINPLIRELENRGIHVTKLGIIPS
jgi:putative NIF3 family GTP cyclohydrolase 1 type 2